MINFTINLFFGVNVSAMSLFLEVVCVCLYGM